MNENAVLVRRLDVACLSLLPRTLPNTALSEDLSELSRFVRESASLYPRDPGAWAQRMELSKQWLEEFLLQIAPEGAGSLICIVPSYWSSAARSLLRQAVANTGRFGDCSIMTDIVAGAAVLEYHGIREDALCVSEHATGVMHIRYQREDVAWRLASVDMTRKFKSAGQGLKIVGKPGPNIEGNDLFGMDPLDVKHIADALSAQATNPVKFRYQTELVLGLPGIGEIVWPASGPYPAFHAERVAVVSAPSEFYFPVSARYCPDQKYPAWICSPGLNKDQKVRMIEKNMNVHFDIGLQLHDGMTARLFTEMIEPGNKKDSGSHSVMNIEIPHPVD